MFKLRVENVGETTNIVRLFLFFNLIIIIIVIIMIIFFNVF